eukprot:3566285-Alexandrium_andersonii.AAC.1
MWRRSYGARYAGPDDPPGAYAAGGDSGDDAASCREEAARTSGTGVEAVPSPGADDEGATHCA